MSFQVSKAGDYSLFRQLVTVLDHLCSETSLLFVQWEFTMLQPTETLLVLSLCTSEESLAIFP